VQAPATRPSPFSRSASPVAEALQSLRRAIATVRSYPNGNNLSESALSDLLERLGRVLPLQLTIGQEGILDVEGTPIEIDEGFRSLVRELYRDGVREMRIEAGISRSELDRWVGVFAAPRDTQNLSEDYVTLFWEAQLPHVVVRALDPYLDRDIPGDVLEGKERPTGQIEGIAAELLPNTPPPPEEAFRLSEADREVLEKERRAAAADSPWPSFVRALSEVLHSPVGERRADEIRGVVEAALFSLVAEGQLALARDLAEEIRGRGDAATESWRGVFSRACQAERLAPLCKALERDLSQQPIVRQLLLALGPGSLDATQQFVREAGAAGARRAWAETLAAFGESGRVRLAALLSMGGDSVACCAARVLAATGERRYLDEIWQAFEAATRPARRDLLRAVATLAGESERGRLLAVALADPDDDCRVLALAELARFVGPYAAAALLARARSRSFEALAEREKDALYRALAVAGGSEVVAFLESGLSGGWLARGDHGDRLRAARSLAREGSEAALAVLRERAAGRGEVADLCRSALRGIA